MTRIEKTVWQISDMLDFYNRIHKLKANNSKKTAESPPHRIKALKVDNPPPTSSKGIN